MDENIVFDYIDEISLEKYAHIGNLSYIDPDDRVLIITQCEHQNATSDEQIYGFMQAYQEAKLLAQDKSKLSQLSKEQILNLIQHWAELTEKQNSKGWRNTPVTFINGDRGVDYHQIPRQMDIFAEEFANPTPETTSEELYEFFEKIHPLEDGNGRLGDLLWKIDVTRKTGEWPKSLPPKSF